MRAVILGLLMALAILSRGAPASAEEVAAARPGVAWSPSWRRVRWWGYAGTVVFDLGSLYFYRYRQMPAQQRWRGENPFDDTVRGWLRADTREGRLRANAVSDWIGYARFVMPFGVDVPVALLIHRDPDVAWQLFAMDMEAFAVAGFLNNFLFYEVGRGRPDLPDCATDPSYDRLCGLGNFSSFPSGHTLGFATAAGLSCVHHRYLPLYGHPAADGGVCALMAAGTVATAVARVMSDRHFASDVLAGAAIGFGSGYGLPWLLHYRTGGDRGEARVMLLPFADARRAGLSLVGRM